jgi:hypothetical protein
MRRLIGAASMAAVLGMAMTATSAAAADGGGAQRISQGDPYASCTAGADGAGVSYPSAEVEPSVSVDPRNPDRVIGVFQQDRWSDGGAKGLAAVWSANGRDFHQTALPFDACASGGLSLYDRASDAWVSFGPDGTAYADGLGLSIARNSSGVAAATSYDGGRTWRNTTVLVDDPSARFSDDKNSVTADPVRPGVAYAVWDRFDFGPGLNQFTARTVLSETRDYGHTWSQPRVIVDPGQNTQTQGNVIVVDRRTGRLYNFYNLIAYTDATASTVARSDEAFVSSDDGGRTWSPQVIFAHDTSIVDRDPNTGAALRTGAGPGVGGALPSAAIDPHTGELYVAYESTDFTGGARDQIQLVHSVDGGRTWSRPVRVNGAPQAVAFTPTVAVAGNGAVGVTYYDTRTLQPGNTTTLPAGTFLATSPRGGKQFTDHQIAAPFDELSAPNAGGFFVGDYEGLTAFRDEFRAMFVETNSGQPADRTDVFTGTFHASPR